jgi:hypothetical protein
VIKEAGRTLKERFSKIEESKEKSGVGKYIQTNQNELWGKE